MWKNNDCPCTRDCPDRWVSDDGGKPQTCHGTCSRYKRWAEKRAADKKAHEVKAARYAMTESKKRSSWARCRRDYSGATKKFS